MDASNVENETSGGTSTVNDVLASSTTSCRCESFPAVLTSSRRRRSPLEESNNSNNSSAAGDEISSSSSRMSNLPTEDTNNFIDQGGGNSSTTTINNNNTDNVTSQTLNADKVSSDKTDQLDQTNTSPAIEYNIDKTSTTTVDNRHSKDNFSIRTTNQCSQNDIRLNSQNPNTILPSSFQDAVDEETKNSKVDNDIKLDSDDIIYPAVALLEKDNERESDKVGSPNISDTSILADEEVPAMITPTLTRHDGVCLVPGAYRACRNGTIRRVESLVRIPSQRLLSECTETREVSERSNEYDNDNYCRSDSYPLGRNTSLNSDESIDDETVLPTTLQRQHRTLIPSQQQAQVATEDELVSAVLVEGGNSTEFGINQGEENSTTDHVQTQQHLDETMESGDNDHYEATCTVEQQKDDLPDDVIVARPVNPNRQRMISIGLLLLTSISMLGWYCAERQNKNNRTSASSSYADIDDPHLTDTGLSIHDFTYTAMHVAVWGYTSIVVGNSSCVPSMQSILPQQGLLLKCRGGQINIDNSTGSSCVVDSKTRISAKCFLRKENIDRSEQSSSSSLQSTVLFSCSGDNSMECAATATIVRPTVEARCSRNSTTNKKRKKTFLFPSSRHNKKKESDSTTTNSTSIVSAAFVSLGRFCQNSFDQWDLWTTVYLCERGDQILLRPNGSIIENPPPITKEVIEFFRRDNDGLNDDDTIDQSYLLDAQSRLNHANKNHPLMLRQLPSKAVVDTRYQFLSDVIDDAKDLLSPKLQSYCYTNASCTSTSKCVKNCGSKNICTFDVPQVTVPNTNDPRSKCRSSPDQVPSLDERQAIVDEVFTVHSFIADLQKEMLDIISQR